MALLDATLKVSLIVLAALRPRVLLPAGARLWDADRIRVVLCHELAHVRRGDWAVQMCGELLRCALWFNPLVWIALMRLRDESEHACDDAVLNQGIEGREYAWQLLQVARGFTRHAGVWLPAPAIARASSLERRIGAMLNGRIDRRPMTRRTVLGVAVAFALLALPLAAAQTGPPALSGTVLDPGGLPVARVRLVLSSDATRVVQTQDTDAAGRFDFGELPAGEYLLQVRPPDFPRVGLTFSLEPGEREQRELVLEVPGISISTSVAFPPQPARPERSLPNDWSCLPDNPALCGPPSLLEEFARDEEEYARSDQRMLPARWTHRFDNLRYPDALRDSGVVGRVVIQGRIGTDGFPAALRVASSVHPELDTAALRSVSEWTFTPARLNGVAVDVPLTATIEYRNR